MLSKKERLNIFIKQLNDASAASNDSEAYELLSTILNDVEDEHTLIPNTPETWDSDGRMYPPQEDHKHTESSEITRYRNRNHNTYFGSNGSIRIETVNGKVILLDKAGLDGRKVGDL